MQDKFSAAGTCSPVRFEAYLPLNRSPFRAAPAVSVRSATVQNAIPYRFRRLRPSLVAQCNEGCNTKACLTLAHHKNDGVRTTQKVTTRLPGSLVQTVGTTYANITVASKKIQRRWPHGTNSIGHFIAGSWCVPRTAKDAVENVSHRDITPTTQSPWKFSGSVGRAILPKTVELLGCASQVTRHDSCGQSVFCCLTGAQQILCKGFGRSSRPDRTPTRRELQPRVIGDIGSNPVRQSILETAEDAMYSSLRRKKSHGLPGDTRPRPTCEWTTLARGAIRKQFACLTGLKTVAAAGRLCSLLRTLEATATAKSKSTPGEGSWSCG